MRYDRLFALLGVVLSISCVPADALAAPPPGASCTLGGSGPLAQLPTDRQPDGPVTIILTEDWIIGNEQGLTTLSPSITKSPSNLAEVFGHPGITRPVTIQTNGHQIVVRDNGALILEEFDNSSAELRVEGEHADGLFHVADGGELVLNQVHVKTGGVAVYLEKDAYYKWGNANNKPYPEPSKTGDTVPLAALELYADPNPLLVFDGNEWSGELPGQKVPTLKVFCSVDGQRENEFRRLEVTWDTTARADALSRREDCILEGRFPDGEGGWLPSRFTPELPVRFLPRGPARLLKSRFTRTGMGNYYGELRFEPPQEAQAVWLEVSEDEGRSWRQPEHASVVHAEEYLLASFFQPDDLPRRYRLVVEGGPNEGASEPVTLPNPPTVGTSTGSMDDDDNDFGGNRGGGTVLNPPERELASSTPESRADAPMSSSSAEVSAISPTPTGQAEREASIVVGPQAQPDIPDSAESPVAAVGAKDAVPSAPEPVHVASSDTERQARPAAAPAEDVETPEEPPHTFSPSPAGQAAAAAAGIAACGGVGVLAASRTLRGKLLAALRRRLSRR